LYLKGQLGVGVVVRGMMNSGSESSVPPPGQSSAASIAPRPPCYTALCTCTHFTRTHAHPLVRARPCHVRTHTLLSHTHMHAPSACLRTCTITCTRILRVLLHAHTHTHTCTYMPVHTNCTYTRLLGAQHLSRHVHTPTACCAHASHVHTLDAVCTAGGEGGWCGLLYSPLVIGCY